MLSTARPGAPLLDDRRRPGVQPHPIAGPHPGVQHLLHDRVRRRRTSRPAWRDQTRPAQCLLQRVQHVDGIAVQQRSQDRRIEGWRRAPQHRQRRAHRRRRRLEPQPHHRLHTRRHRSAARDRRGGGTRGRRTGSRRSGDATPQRRGRQPQLLAQLATSISAKPPSRRCRQPGASSPTGSAIAAVAPLASASRRVPSPRDRHPSGRRQEPQQPNDPSRPTADHRSPPETGPSRLPRRRRRRTRRTAETWQHESSTCWHAQQLAERSVVPRPAGRVHRHGAKRSQHLQPRPNGGAPSPSQHDDHTSRWTTRPVSSRANRDLPTPGSPDTITTRARPANPPSTASSPDRAPQHDRQTGPRVGPMAHSTAAHGDHLGLIRHRPLLRSGLHQLPMCSGRARPCSACSPRSFSRSPSGRWSTTNSAVDWATTRAPAGQ